MNDRAEPGLGEVLRALFRRWYLPVLGAILAVAAAFALLSVLPVRYRAEAQVLLDRDPAASIVQADDGSRASEGRRLSNEAAFAEGALVLGAIEAVVDDSVSLEVLTDDDRDVLRMTAVADDPVEAARLADDLARIYIGARRDFARASLGNLRIEVEREVDQLSDQINQLFGRDDEFSLQRLAALQERETAQRTRLEQVRLIEARPSALNPIQLGQAEIPEFSTLPRKAIALPGAAIAGLLLGGLLAISLGSADTRIRSANAASASTGVPTIGMPVLDTSRLAKGSDPDVAAGSVVHWMLDQVPVDRGHSFYVTAPHGQPVPVDVAIEIAAALTQTRARVVIVDATAHGALPSWLGADGTAGMSEVLSGRMDAFDVLQYTLVPGLRSLSTGTGSLTVDNLHPSDTGRGLAGVIADLVAADAAVIVIAPSVGSPLLQPIADATTAGVLTVAAGRTKHDNLSEAVQLLDGCHARLLGLVMVGAGRTARPITAGAGRPNGRRVTDTVDLF